MSILMLPPSRTLLQPSPYRGIPLPPPIASHVAGPYTHYVHAQHPNATDDCNSHGTADKPRITLPDTWTPGMVVEVHGMFTGKPLSVPGTLEQPIVIRGVPGDEPIHTGTGFALPNASHVIFEHIKFAWEGGSDNRIWCKNSPCDNIVVRHCEFFNGQHDPSRAYQVGRFYTSNGTISNLFWYGNHFHDCGAGRLVGVKADMVPISVDQGVRDVWVLGNVFERIGGDGIQISGDKSVEASQHPYRIFVAGNVASDMFENFIDVKQCRQVIISENECYWIGNGYGVVAGDKSIAIRAGSYDGNPELGSRDHLWIIGNHIYECDSTNSCISSSVSASLNQPYPTGYYALDNRIHNCNASTGSGGTAMYVERHRHASLVGNTIYDCSGGLRAFGSQESTVTDDTLEIVENIVSNVQSGAIPQALAVGLMDAAEQQYRISHNVFHQSMGDPSFRIYHQDGQGGASSTSYNNLASFGEAYPSFVEGTTDSNPHINYDSGHLRNESPVRFLNSGVRGRIYREFLEAFPDSPPLDSH